MFPPDEFHEAGALTAYPYDWQVGIEYTQRGTGDNVMRHTAMDWLHDRIDNEGWWWDNVDGPSA